MINYVKWKGVKKNDLANWKSGIDKLNIDIDTDKLKNVASGLNSLKSRHW